MEAQDIRSERVQWRRLKQGNKQHQQKKEKKGGAFQGESADVAIIASQGCMSR